MICQPCAEAADTRGRSRSHGQCEGGCPCQHRGTPFARQASKSSRSSSTSISTAASAASSSPARGPGLSQGGRCTVRHLAGPRLLRPVDQFAQLRNLVRAQLGHAVAAVFGRAFARKQTKHAASLPAMFTRPAIGASPPV